MNAALLLSLSLLIPSLPAADLKTLPEGKLSSIQKNLLEELRTAPPPGWMATVKSLSSRANQAVLVELVNLSKEENDELRIRAGLVLIEIRTQESLEQATLLALSDSKDRVRRTISSSMLSGEIPESMKEAGLIESVQEGVEDSHEEVQFSFAVLLAMAGDDTGIPVLRKSLKNRDHHRRESAAEALATIGDDSGIDVLIKMLRYTNSNHPFLKANREMKKDRVVWEGFQEGVRKERVRVCGHLGRLGNRRGLAVLKKWSTSSDEVVATAARKAREEIESPAEPSSDNG